LNTELGLNWIQFKWRNHDPAIGRFFNIDPLTEDYTDWGPYIFSGNRVIDAWELEGLEPVLISLASEKTKDKDPTGEAFKAFFPKDGLARQLIDHYTGGTGQTFELNRDQLLEAYPIINSKGLPINISLSNFDMLSVGNLKPGESAEFSDSVPVYAGTAGTLGNFSVTREGTVTLNAETGEREFEGTFSFSDTFDFNAANRPFFAELQVTVARNILPGSSFEISGELPVFQIQGQNVTTTTSNGIRINPALYPKPDDTETRQEEFDN